MKKHALMQLGLTGNEADIYLALLELGPSQVSKIVEKTKLNRTNIYDRLERLISKGIVSYSIKNKKKLFFAASPKRLINYLEEKEEEIHEKKRMIEAIIPQLECISPEKDKETIEIYEGKEGLKTILEDIIQSGKGIVTYGSEGNFSRILKFYFRHYLSRLKKAGIKMQVIFNSDDDTKSSGLKFAKVRYLPKEYKTPTESTVYGEKVAIFLLTKEPKAILIRSKAIADAYRKYFSILWKISKASPICKPAQARSKPKKEIFK